MQIGKVIRIAGVAGAALLAFAPASAQAPGLAMLERLDRGQWTLSMRGGGSQRICVRTGREFIQLRHRQPGCERFVVGDESNEVTVQYTCRGNGYGRTTIRRESSNLVQVRSQGIHGGRPFSIDAEARRTGSC
ncbi:DUF3617 domain-containing protein [Aurantiacibacter aquimixticola]|uniref:DUF3617 family protein n=1 Tax=Aurantiacibacter aquimixticola TaxID=1958945 RepID=A0A419RX17_9SPHN|nr:hypothetical protein [Aurantiacibacter aquimixticola]RJY10345.1 hypothetical protein D6201_10230 [Aurantiacibacter aquimixticola]